MLPFNEPNLPIDTRLVLDAATALDITEFQLFELAYADWFGDEPDVYRVEPTFVNYMFHGEIPAWVRQYARKTLMNQDARPRALHAAVQQPSRLRGSIYFLILAFALGVLLLTATSSTDLLPAVQECYFPPCY